MLCTGLAPRQGGCRRPFSSGQPDRPSDRQAVACGEPILAPWGRPRTGAAAGACCEPAQADHSANSLLHTLQNPRIPSRIISLCDEKGEKSKSRCLLPPQRRILFRSLKSFQISVLTKGEKHQGFANVKCYLGIGFFFK